MSPLVVAPNALAAAMAAASPPSPSLCTAALPTYDALPPFKLLARARLPLLLPALT